MNIKTAFDINSIVRHKFGGTKTGYGSKTIIRYEVLYIGTETCSAGTQIFYRCRPIQITERDDFKEPSVVVHDVIVSDMTPANRAGGQGECFFREDELLPCDEKMLRIIMDSQQGEQ